MDDVVNMYVCFNDDTTDPTYSGIRDVTLIESRYKVEDDFETILQLKNTQVYSLERMVEVLRENGLLEGCKIHNLLGNTHEEYS